MSKVAAAFAPIGVLLLVLNALGGIVSGIWLGVIGEWWALGVGLVGLFVSPFLVTILLIPGLLFAAPGSALFERGRQGPAMVLAGISSLYTAALIAAWGIGILHLFASRATAHSIIPLLIWSYGVASGPWSFLASKDQQGGGNDTRDVDVFLPGRVRGRHRADSHVAFTCTSRIGADYDHGSGLATRDVLHARPDTCRGAVKGNC